MTTHSATFRRGRDIIVRLIRQSPDDVTLLEDLAQFDSKSRLFGASRAGTVPISPECAVAVPTSSRWRRHALHPTIRR